MALRNLIILALFSLCAISAQAQFSTNLYISEVKFLDRGDLSGSQDYAIDLERGICGFIDQNGDGDTTDSGDVDPEPFFDTLVSITVKNPSSTPVNVSKLFYRLPNATGKLKKWIGGLYPVTSGFIQAKSEATISYLMFKSGPAGKSTFKPAINLPANLRLQDVALRLDVRDSLGRLQRISTKRGLSFGNENRCSE